MEIDADNFPIKVESGFVYEVFKIINSKALFLLDHIQRLNKSLKIKSLPLINIDKFVDLVSKFLDANNRVEGNVKIVIVVHDTGASIPIMYYIPHHYPSKNQYEKGVKLALQNAVRSTPHAKISNLQIRNKANSLISNSDIYETLLVNEENEITEGSRSNVFFIIGNELITAPDNMVLLGITRDKIISLANELKIPLRYEALAVDKIQNIDAAFIAGTSPGILQILGIEEFHFEIDNPIYLNLFRLFNQ